jgi:hypothetical protein
MRLKDVEVCPSPLRGDFMRVSAKIEIESKGLLLSYWIEVPADLNPSLSDSGNPWAVLMLPLACYFGETLVMELPLDRVLHDNLLGLRSVWSAWYPEIKSVPIEAHRLVGIDRREMPTDLSKRTISCFSGGIDSLFTFYRHKDQVLGDGTALIDDFLCVGGFNTPLDDFDQMRARLGPFAGRFGRTLVPILTNIRYGDHAIETLYSIGSWEERLAHGAFLAAIVHLLGRRYREFLIPPSFTYSYVQPWGSHPMCDPLLSASDLRVVHDGASFNRAERTAVVVRHDESLDVLQVCARNGYGLGNCSRCEKCLRTMATLDLMGVMGRAGTFDWSCYSVQRLCRVWLPSRSQQDSFEIIAERADREGRPDIARAARASLAFSRRRKALLDLVNSNPISRAAWRGVRTARRSLLRSAPR